MFANKTKAARRIGKSTKTIDRWVKAGKLKKYQEEGKHPLYCLDEINALILGFEVVESDITWIW